MLASADEVDDLAEGDINVQKTQATEGAAEVWVVPDVLDGDLILGEETGDVVEAPGIHPGEDYQEGSDFKGEEGEQHDP